MDKQAHCLAVSIKVQEFKTKMLRMCGDISTELFEGVDGI